MSRLVVTFVRLEYVQMNNTSVPRVGNQGDPVIYLGHTVDDPPGTSPRPSELIILRERQIIISDQFSWLKLGSRLGVGVITHLLPNCRFLKMVLSETVGRPDRLPQILHILRAARG